MRKNHYVRVSNAQYTGDVSADVLTTPAKRIKNPVINLLYYSNLAKAEATLANEKDDEYGIFFNRRGKFVAAYKGVGERINYRFSQEDISLLTRTVHTHNHPRSDASFSVEDVQLASRLELSELRVVTRTYLYVMRPGSLAWNKMSFGNTIQPTYAAAEAFVQQNRLSQIENLSDYQHEIWRELSERLGMIYSKTRRG